MSCGTGRISRGQPPQTKQEKVENAMRFLNTPDLYKTAAPEEYAEVMEYLKPEKGK